MDLLKKIEAPGDLRRLSRSQLKPLADELRDAARAALEASGLASAQSLLVLADLVVDRES